MYSWTPKPYAWNSPFYHGPERLSERPPHSQHVDWHALYPNDVILHGPTDRREAALTFDDGPDRVWTPRILSVLAQYGVKAEFNCVGQRVQQSPHMLEQIIQEGHNVENHSWSHPNFTKIPVAKAKRQIEQTNLLIEQITGVRPRFFRPPYGALNDEVIREVIALGMKILYWNVDSLDWSGLTRKQVVANVLGHTEPGAIILMHFAGGRGESLDGTVQALPYIIQTLRREGYTFKTVSALLNIPAYL
ncbi:polysaccharide deacetylase family protein [Alicyclobacillus tolerans]|uniref:polysaccharide deacetylase family protein n=1 Tax=Alicyclobacillus tolerans TaxID=90970 RepID=UPI001F1B4776|nr:polysaccharide deacetylase family protein [Alicyclobacillus tolerans]MCF8563381.1 polysaccharide deacetylase family protein [Alicyclobacillus tolerans]